MARSSWMIGVAAGLVAGALSGWLVRGEMQPSSKLDEPPVSESEGPAEAGNGADVEFDDVTDPAPVDESSLRTAAEGQGNELDPARGDVFFTARLLAHAREGIRSGWMEMRQDEPSESQVEDGMATFREQTLESPVWIGASMARDLNETEAFLEDTEKGGLFELLEKLDDDSPGPVFDLVADPLAFDKYFEAGDRGPSLDGVSASGRDQAVPDGSTLSFTAGVHYLDSIGNRWRTRFPRDLTIKGVGKDATMIVLRGAIYPNDVVRNITFENCTIHANNKTLIQTSNKPASVTIRSCRVLGWLSGAGGSNLFGSDSLALRAIDSEFTGAYGRIMSSGRLFDVRSDGLLARFENCTLDATIAFDGTYDDSTILLLNCQTKNLRDRGKSVPSNVRLVRTGIDWYTGTDPEELRRDLNELFPDWKEQLRRSR